MMQERDIVRASWVETKVVVAEESLVCFMPKISRVACVFDNGLWIACRSVKAPLATTVTTAHDKSGGRSAGKEIVFILVLVHVP